MVDYSGIPPMADAAEREHVLAGFQVASAAPVSPLPSTALDRG